MNYYYKTLGDECVIVFDNEVRSNTDLYKGPLEYAYSGLAKMFTQQLPNLLKGRKFDIVKVTHFKPSQGYSQIKQAEKNIHLFVKSRLCRRFYI